MSGHSEPALQEHLEVTLTKGGKITFSSEEEKKKKGEDKPKLVPDPKGVKICLECGDSPVAVIFQCPKCGKRYQRMLDTKTGQSMFQEEPVISPKSCQFRERFTAFTKV